MNNVTIRLGDGPGRPWTHSDGVHVCGHLMLGRRVLDKGELVEWIQSSGAGLTSSLEAASGEFALVSEQSDGMCHLVVDPVRSIPLYYGRSATGAIVSDNAESVAAQLQSSTADDIEKLAFVLQGMCLSNGTLARDVRQVRAGEMVTIHPDGTASHLYVKPGHLPLSEKRENRLDQAVAVVETAFEKMLSTIDAPVAIPLSGGLDSRLIASILVRHGRTDAVCYTYGSKRTFDAAISRHVAESLGLRWEFVPYSNRRWRHWAASQDFRAYRRRASGLTAIEHEQDWPAVRKLREDGTLPENTVIVPGHSGDFLAGSHLPEDAFVESRSRALDWIWERYFTFWPTNHLPKALLEKLRERIHASLCEDDSEVLRFDEYGWRHRQAMMIVNSVRAYEDHGCDWRLPLWDREMIDFWMSLPKSDRRDKSLYVDAVRRLIGPLANIPSADNRSVLRRKLSPKLRDYGLYRYGMFAGLRPSGKVRVIGDLVRESDTLLDDIIRPVRKMPIRRMSVNTLMTLLQLDDSLAVIAGTSNQRSVSSRNE